MTDRRCPQHGEALRRGLRARVPATALTGRKHAFHLAERTHFPAAAAFLFCREGSLAAEFCPACRTALAAWLAAGMADGRAELAGTLARALRAANR